MSDVPWEKRRRRSVIGTYLFRVWMTGYDEPRVRELQEALARLIAGGGTADAEVMLRKVDDGQRALVYQTNSPTDAEVTARTLTWAGAEVEVEEATGTMSSQAH